MLPKMVDMALTPQEKSDMNSPVAMFEARNYPWGLQINLCHDDLEKLGLDDNCEVGDFIHIFAMAKVNSVSKNDSGDGEKCNISLQITHMGVESEDAENEEAEQAPPKRKSMSASLYKKR